jgi:hypothetical protein
MALSPSCCPAIECHKTETQRRYMRWARSLEKYLRGKQGARHVAGKINVARATRRDVRSSVLGRFH